MVAISAKARSIGWRISPHVVVVFSIVICMLATGASLYCATAQPFLGLSLGVADDGTIRIGPDAPGNLGGTRVMAIGLSGQPLLGLEPSDMVEEPDTFPTFEQQTAFMSRQTELARILEGEHVDLVVSAPGGGAERIVLATEPNRPIQSMPADYWVQLAVGVAGLMIGAWVWALRRNDPAAFLLYLTGACLMLAAVAASVYSTRELAIDAGLFRVLSSLNHLGSIGFGAALISLLLVYPKRLVPFGWTVGVWVLTLAVWMAQNLQLSGDASAATYGVIFLDFVIIAILLGIQFFFARKDLRARAALGWFGLSILLGTGVFVFTIAAPILIGIEPQISQGSSFALFLLLYAGLALGIARYRLFDLDVWAFRLASYMLGAILLVGLDAVLIYAVSIERVPALGLALLVVALLYLPLRNWLGWMIWGERIGNLDRFEAIVDVAFKRSAADQNRAWQALLDAQFQPLTLEQTSGIDTVGLLDEGLGLAVPGTGSIAGAVLRHAAHGRRLFSWRDVERAGEHIKLLDYVIGSRDAREAGVRAERSRIARDLHDNIGAQLMRTLNSPDPARKDEIVGETLLDLRDIISNAQGNGIGLTEMLAELRYETDERLADAALTLSWRLSVNDGVAITAGLAHTIRSIVREAATNAVRHSNAQTLSIMIGQTETGISIAIEDDGTGFNATAPHSGHGLENMRLRASSHGGKLHLDTAGGTRIALDLPTERMAG